MEISQISSIFKRIAEMRSFLTISSASDDIKMRCSNTLEVLSKVLIDCWKAGVVGSSQSAQISHLLRELEDLNERIRLSGGQTLAKSFEK